MRYRRSECPYCGGQRRAVQGSWLKEKRKKSKLTQEKMAARIGVSRSYYSDLENERRSASVEVQMLLDEMFKD